MEITVKSEDGLILNLSVELDKTDYQQQLNKAFQEIRKDLDMPGFRPGKCH